MFCETVAAARERIDCAISSNSAGLAISSPVLKGGGTLDADISADSLSGLRRSREFEDLADKQYVPSIIATGDAQLCAAAFKRAGESDPITTYAKLMNSQLVVVERAGAVLFDLHRERVIAPTPLEAREPKFLPVFNRRKNA